MMFDINNSKNNDYISECSMSECSILTNISEINDIDISNNKKYSPNLNSLDEILNELENIIDRLIF